MMTWTTDGWGWAIMALMMVLFWGGLIALIAFATRRPDPHEDRKHSPKEILEERFALGEISAEEFEEAKRVLARQDHQGAT